MMRMGFQKKKVQRNPGDWGSLHLLTILDHLKTRLKHPIKLQDQRLFKPSV